jgi:hypothetical protein
VLSLIPSGIGFVLFVYGKKQQRWPHLAAGLLMMIYPYFMHGVASLLIAGTVITAVLWYVVRLGW